jgi:hypothetical protein
MSSKLKYTDEDTRSVKTIIIDLWSSQKLHTTNFHCHLQNQQFTQKKTLNVQKMLLFLTTAALKKPKLSLQKVKLYTFRSEMTSNGNHIFLCQAIYTSLQQTQLFSSCYF